jgi:outer membrane receptor protein involved in Fe transport
MKRKWTFVTTCLVSAFVTSVALGQALYHFNLPQQALADSLRAIGSQTATSILFEPATVENTTAAAVRGQLSAIDAVTRALAGTQLTAEQTAANTVLVRSPRRQTNVSFPPTIRLAQAEPASDQSAPLEQVVVTGSLIPQSKPYTVAPQITISADDIDDQGFRNVYEALRTLPIANGSVQDAQFTGGFTPGASAISLFGLDPSFTLTLLNGRPLADYPMPFNGSSDITDLSNIPVGLIDHIDILTGAASSIYGSSAIAGVVNVVLKDKVDGTLLTARVGGYSQGGGRNGRVQLSSGFSGERLDVVYGLELTHQDKMLQREVSGLSVLSHDNFNNRNFLVAVRGAGYADPGAARCAPLANLFDGTLTYSYQPGQGYYCGSSAAGYGSIINQDNKINGLFSAKYRILDNTVAYTQLLYGYSEPTYSGGAPSWTTSRVTGNLSGYIWNQNTQRAELLRRMFDPSEFGGWHGQSQHVFTNAFNGSFGLKGAMGDSDFNYDAYYHISQQNAHYVSYNASFVNQLAAAYYLGPQLGVTDEGYPIFAPNWDRFYSPLTPAQYDSFTGVRSEHSVSWTEDVTAIVNNSNLFSLPAGSVGAAVLAQYGMDQVHAPLDPQAAAGVFDGSAARPNSGGKRKHYSLGSELRVPIVRLLTADLSGRYDHYAYEGGTGFGGSNSAEKFTYRGGLELRPREDLLFRANYATAFRTPDLFYLFEGSTGSYSSRTDWYQCRQAGYTTRNIDDCPLSASGSQVSPLTLSSGSTHLQNITAKSYTYGVVWSPLDKRLRLSVDYSRVDIKNKVQQVDMDALLQTEANCRLGQSEGGQAYDIDSPTCQDALAVIERQVPLVPLDTLSITLLHSVPVNIALEHEAGIQAEARYSWATQEIGGFSVDTKYFRQLQHTTKNFPGDVPLDQLCCYNNDEFFNTLTADAAWNLGKFSTTLHGIRYPKTWADDGSERNVGPLLLVNGSERYELTPGSFVQLTVNNIFNRLPPIDSARNSYPYYDIFIYNSYGRAYWLELGVKLGGSPQ